MIKALAIVALALGAFLVARPGGAQQAGGFITVGLTGTDNMTPRGIRNNNPGNIRHGEPWKGMSARQTDPEYIQFTDARWGIRAMARVLSNYNARHGINTIRGIVTRWAPPVGQASDGTNYRNPTEAYVLGMAAALGAGPDEPINIHLRMAELVRYIIRHENGQQPYTDQQIREAISWA